MEELPNNLDKIVQAAIYARVSSEEQREGKTIDSQIKELEDFAKASNYKIIGRYIDDAWSGTILERPELDRLRDDAGKNLFEAVLVNDVDRLSREMLHLGIIKQDLEKKGVKLIFKKLPNSGDPLSNFMINVLGSFAEFERQMIADRIRRGKRYKAEVKHLILGNTPPFGYNYIPRTKGKRGKEGFYKINKKEAKIVRRMFKWVEEEGLSQREVVKRLVERKIPARKASEWPKSSVHRVLTNPTYIGITYWNRHKAVEPEKPKKLTKYRRRKKSSSILRPKVEWVPIRLPKQLHIIDKEIFYAAQEQFRRNKCYASRNNTKNFYLLKGLIRCGLCGSPYLGNPCYGKLYYRCGNRGRTFPRPKECKAGMVSALKIEKLVWNAIVNAIQNPSVITNQVQKFEEKQKKQPILVEQEVKETEEDLRKLEREEERLFLAYREEAIQLEQFKKEINIVNAEREQLNSVLEGLKNKESSQIPRKEAIRSIKDYCRLFKRKLDQFTLEQRLIFLRLLIDKIIIEGRKVRILGLIPVFTEAQKRPSLQFNSLSQTSMNHIVLPSFLCRDRQALAKPYWQNQ